ncbi:putative late blight resistance protein homolog R1B-14 [Salvia miltiorrhiza]|uniref:putative late blight resistance protein homolog R1B-14 n=1 Tax=Salvia miltiorrhiza TaxID=226208 RepID=UPI0025AD03C8|nr:putative late blight resistance protein homolog R1B-14 [Salvia miltiorrhiza]
MEHFMYEDTRSRYRAAGEATEIDEYDFREVKIAMEEMNSIAEERVQLSNRAPMRLRSAPSSSPTPTPAPAAASFTVGLEKDLEKIRVLVCGEWPERQIIPITGMGGIGKTTLATKIFDDPLVVEMFPIRAWITVSQDYNPENIFENLLYSLGKVVQEAIAESSISTVQKLYQILTVKKYLVVVEDLWSGKAWDDIKMAFGDPRSRNGSRILITTRITSVASHVSPSSPLHQMRFLKPDESWNLLKHKVFPSKQFVRLQKKEGGVEGLKNRRRRRVAAVLSDVGESPDSWEEVAEDVYSAIDKNGEFDRIMSLSYTHLPLYLRPCFLYIGSFPKDYEIRVSKLIKLWMAEGFVENGDEAEAYLSDLMKTSLVFTTATKSNGKVKSCNVHDMIRDLCRRKAVDENYERRLSIAHPDLTRLARTYASTLRSVISFRPTESSLGRLRKFKLLRVLDVVDTDAYTLPAPVFELFHLRYLAFGCGMEIPTTIARLQNLRALIIRPSKRLRHYSVDEVYLPLEVWMMPLLTHLVSFYDLLPNPERAASALDNLLTLSVVKKLICTEEMMKMISNVKKLAITYFGDRYKEDYQLQNLVLLHQLEKLTLVVKKGYLLEMKAKPVFPKTLRKLTLSGWRFPWEDMEAVASLPHLQVLKLRDHACEGDTWETNEEQFQKLEYLLIDESDLENWDTGKLHFRILKRLVLHGCGKLREIPDDIGNISTLELIEVDRVNTSLVECVQHIQEDQIHNYDNKLLQVRTL